MTTKKTLTEIHADVPADHYDISIKRNLFQRYWHSRRFSEILKIIKPVKGPVLDIGCHAGTFTANLLTKLGTDEIYGVDISKSAIHLIKKRLPKGHFQVSNASYLLFNNNFFDAVFCLEVLEHVDDPFQILMEAKRVLKKGGYCIVLIPTDNLLFKTIWFLWTLCYPVWRHAHVFSFKNHKFENLIKKLDMEITFRKTFNLGMLKIITLTKN